MTEFNDSAKLRLPYRFFSSTKLWVAQPEIRRRNARITPPKNKASHDIIANDMMSPPVARLSGMYPNQLWKLSP
jgi:hypothetical protein